GGGQPRRLSADPRPAQADRQRPDRGCPRDLTAVSSRPKSGPLAPRAAAVPLAERADHNPGGFPMATKPAVRFETMDELLRSLGGISPTRVRMIPTPGTATVRDVASLLDRHERKFELVDGTLVEKIMGQKESFVA